MAIGRGLASLIPNRRTQDLDEDFDEIEAIDSMEEVENTAEDTPTAEAEPAAEVESGNTVGIPVVEEDDEDGLDVPVAEEEASEEMTAQVADEPVAEVEEVETAEGDEVFDELELEDDDIDTPIEDTFDDFGQLNDGEELPAPVKPLITPLELDPEEDADLIDIARQAARSKEDVHQPKARLPERLAKKVEKIEKEAETKPVVPAEKPAEKKVRATAAGDKFDQHEEQVHLVPIGDVSINPLQPRRNFDPAELTELKESIEQHGILQPLVVRRLGPDTYELIAGERRLRASKELGWSKVPAVVRRDVAGDQTRLVYALIENIQREGLDPIELALAYKSLHDDFGLSHEEIGKRVGKSRVSVTNDLRVLQLPAEVQRGLSEGKITTGHGRAILMIPDAEKQVRFYKHLLDEGLTVRKAETRARRIQRTMGIHDPMRQKKRNRHPLAQKYAPALEERYSTNVNVAMNEDKNRFEVLFKAYSMKEFEELAGRLLGTVDLPKYAEDDDVLTDD